MNVHTVRLHSYIYFTFYLIEEQCELNLANIFATLFARWECQFCIGTVLLVSLLFPNIFTNWMLKWNKRYYNKSYFEVSPNFSFFPFFSIRRILKVLLINQTSSSAQSVYVFFIIFLIESIVAISCFDNFIDVILLKLFISMLK